MNYKAPKWAIKIEIIPIDCDKFDAFSFIDFALALNLGIYAKQKYAQKN